MTKLLFTSMVTIGWVLTGTGLAQVGDQKPEAEAKSAKDDPKHQEAVEILKKVDAATKAVKLVSYSATSKGTGWVATRLPTVEGQVVMSGEKSESALSKMRISCKVQAPESSETRTLTAGYDGEEFYLIDDAKKMVYADLDPQVMGSDGRIIQSLVMREFSHPTPFSDEINSVKAEIQGTEKIGDEECWQIHVLYRPTLEAIWYFSKKDHLPRRVDRVNTNASGEKGAAQLTLTDLKVDPKFPEDPYKLVVPEGYEKTDEFAPSTRPAR